MHVSKGALLAGAWLMGLTFRCMAHVCMAHWPHFQVHGSWVHGSWVWNNIDNGTYLSRMNIPDLAGRWPRDESPGPGGSQPGTCDGPKLKS